MDIAQKVGAQQPAWPVVRIQRIELGNALIKEEAVAGHVVMPDADAADRAQGQASEVLRVAQRPFAGADFGDIARGAIDQPVFFDRIPRESAIAAVARAQAVFEADGAAPAAQLDDLVVSLLHIVGVGEPVRRLAQQLVRRPAQDVGPGRADALPDPGRVGDQERILRHVPQPVAFGQLLGDLDLQRLGQGLQRRHGLGAVDQLPRALGDRLHEGDFVGRPGARLLRIEVDDGAQTAAAQEGHDQDGARVGFAGRLQRPRLALAERIGEQVVDNDGLTGRQLRDDALAEDMGRIVAE